MGAVTFAGIVVCISADHRKLAYKTVLLNIEVVDANKTHKRQICL